MSGTLWPGSTRNGRFRSAGGGSRALATVPRGPPAPLMADLLVETATSRGAPRSEDAVALRHWHQNYDALGYVLYRAGRFRRRRVLRKVTELRPTTPGRSRSGEGAASGGRGGPAAAAYRKAIAADPSGRRRLTQPRTSLRGRRLDDASMAFVRPRPRRARVDAPEPGRPRCGQGRLRRARTEWGQALPQRRGPARQPQRTCPR